MEQGRDTILKDKECRICGATYTPDGPAQMYCQTCAKIRKKEALHNAQVAYRERNGSWIGVGKGHHQGIGPTHATYKNGILGFSRKKIASMEVLHCERCDKDLTEYINGDDPKGKYKWCVHHRDWDRNNNNPSNWELLCKSCHQKEHKNPNKSKQQL